MIEYTKSSDIQQEIASKPNSEVDIEIDKIPWKWSSRYIFINTPFSPTIETSCKDSDDININSAKNIESSLSIPVKSKMPIINHNYSKRNKYAKGLSASAY
jgi:hypothetical protein